ncbi:hypothetical protein OSTOST_20290, partial [Ostertagia ostertagi]
MGHKAEKKPGGHFVAALDIRSLVYIAEHEQGRVDDLWSWAYMFIEMRDPLPWARVSHPEAVLGLKGRNNPRETVWFGLMEEVTRLKVNLTDPYDWDGRITDSEGTEKLQEVCKQYDLKYENLPKMETVEDLSEENEQAYFRQVFSPQPTDVPGGEQYEEKKKRGSNTNVASEAQVNNQPAVGNLDESKHPSTNTGLHTAAGNSSLS